MADDLPPVHLHKPAPNLSRTGWVPKIDFEQAVKDSLTAAKLYIVKENAKSKISGDPALVDKLKSFLSIAQDNEDDLDVDSGPVSRLIAERKLQMKAKELALRDANEEMKWKTKPVPKTFKQRLDKFFWSIFDSFRKKFSVLKNVTPLQLLYTIVALVILGLFYFNVLSPLLAIGRNTIIIGQKLPEALSYVSDFNVAKARESLDSLDFAFEDSAQAVAKFQWLLRILSLDQSGYQVSAALSDYAKLAAAAKDMMYVAEPLGTYLERYTDNLYFRPNSDSYLSNSNGLDYSPILLDLLDRQAHLDAAYSKYTDAISHLDTLTVPTILGDTFSNIQGELSKLEIEKMYNMLQHVGSMLGTGEDISYLIAVMDNARLQPAGGSLSALMQLTFRSGAIAEVKVLPVENISMGEWQADETSLAFLNARLFTKVTRLDLSNIDQVSDPKVFSSVLKQAWKQYTGRDITAVIKLDLEGLGSILGMVDGVELEGENVLNDTLLSDLKDLQTTNETIARRNDLIAQIYAKLTDKLFDDLKHNLIPLSNVLSELVNSKKVISSDPELPIYGLLKAIGGDGALLNTSDVPLDIYISTDDTLVSPLRYPAINHATKVMINDDTTLKYSLNLKFPSIGDGEIEGICGPNIIKDLSITGVDPLRVSTADYNDKKCIVASIISETELTVQFNTIQFESFSNNQYNLLLGIPKVFGTETISDVEVSLPSTLSFLAITPELVPVGGKVVFTQNLNMDAIIDLTVNKVN